MREFETMHLGDSDDKRSGRRGVPSESKIRTNRKNERDSRVVTHMPDLGMRSSIQDSAVEEEYHPFRDPARRRPLPSLHGRYLIGCLLFGGFVVVWGIANLIGGSESEKESASRDAGEQGAVDRSIDSQPFTLETAPETPEIASMNDFYPNSFGSDASSGRPAPWNMTNESYSGSSDAVPNYGSPTPAPYDAVTGTEYADPYAQYGSSTPRGDMTNIPSGAGGYDAANQQYQGWGQPAVTPLPPVNSAPYDQGGAYASQPLQDARTPYDVGAGQYGQGVPYATDPMNASAAASAPWNIPEPAAVTWDSANAWTATPAANPNPQVVQQSVPQNWSSVAQPNSTTPLISQQPLEQTAMLGQSPQGMTVPQAYPTGVLQNQQYQNQPRQTTNEYAGLGYPSPEVQASPQWTPGANMPMNNSSAWTNQSSQPNYAASAAPAADAWNQTSTGMGLQQQPINPMSAQQQQTWTSPQTPVYSQGGTMPIRQEIATDIPGMPNDRGVEYTAEIMRPYQNPAPSAAPATANPNAYQQQPQYVAPYQQPPQGAYYQSPGDASQQTGWGQTPSQPLSQPTYR